MAASLKISELNAVASLADGDLFLITDSSESTSKKLTVSSLVSYLNTSIYSTLGTTTGTASMGSFSGSILSANFTVKQLLQELANSVTTEATSRTTADASHTTRLNSLETDPTFVGTISGDDIAIGTDKLTVSSAGGVVASVGFFTGGALTVGGNASLTGNATFSGGVVNFTNGLKIDGTAVTSTATELNYVDGVTSNIQTQLTSLQTTIANLDIDIAPETLDSINELATAMGDDPAFLTTLQTRVTTIESDIATQTELDLYKAHIEARNLQAGLAHGVLYVDNLTGG